MDDPPRREPFDEELYLRTFPDIAQAVRDGKFSSGYHHWALHGRFEVAAGRREAGSEDFPAHRGCREMILNHITQHTLGLPRPYRSIDP
jgi:hypothetical protein